MDAFSLESMYSFNTKGLFDLFKLECPSVLNLKNNSVQVDDVCIGASQICMSVEDLF